MIMHTKRIFWEGKGIRKLKVQLSSEHIIEKAGKRVRARNMERK